MKEASHTRTTRTSGLRLLPGIGLADRSLPERLAGKVSEQLELFASEMRQGLLAASVAIGLEVMCELVDAEVTEVAGAKGKHDPNRSVYRHGRENAEERRETQDVAMRGPDAIGHPFGLVCAAGEQEEEEHHPREGEQGGEHEERWRRERELHLDRVRQGPGERAVELSRDHAIGAQRERGDRDEEREDCDHRDDEADEVRREEPPRVRGEQAPLGREVLAELAEPSDGRAFSWPPSCPSGKRSGETPAPSPPRSAVRHAPTYPPPETVDR